MLIRDQYTCSQVHVNADSGVWINIREPAKLVTIILLLWIHNVFVGILALAANSAARGIAKARGLLEPHVLLLLLCSGGTFKYTPPQPEMTENLKILQTDGWQRGHVSLQLGAFAKICSGYLILSFYECGPLPRGTDKRCNSSGNTCFSNLPHSPAMEERLPCAPTTFGFKNVETWPLKRFLLPSSHIR